MMLVSHWMMCERFHEIFSTQDALMMLEVPLGQGWAPTTNLSHPAQKMMRESSLLSVYCTSLSWAILATKENLFSCEVLYTSFIYSCSGLVQASCFHYCSRLKEVQDV